MSVRKNWSIDETMIAMYVYCLIPFSKIQKTNSTIIHYANLLGRTPSALAMKLGNLARFDPELAKKEIVGLAHGAKTEEAVWNKYWENQESFYTEIEKILTKLNLKTPYPESEPEYLILTEKPNSETEQMVKIRRLQSFFRQSVLSAYDCKCAVTGIVIPQLLVASHIIPWAKDEHNRLNPRNGICLNSIHDKAFDQGLITIDKDYRVVNSSKLKEFYDQEFIANVFKRYEGHQIALPNKFYPMQDAIQYHNDVIFLR